MKTVVLKLTHTIVLAAGLLLTTPFARAQAGSSHPHAHRIRFARGATSKTIQVFLSEEQPSPFYIIKTRAGKKMSVEVTPRAKSEGVVPAIEVTSPSGKSSALFDPKIQRFDTQRTEAGDYLIRVTINLMASDWTNGHSGTFRLKVRILKPPLALLHGKKKAHATPGNA